MKTLCGHLALFEALTQILTPADTPAHTQTSTHSRSTVDSYPCKVEGVGTRWMDR